MDIKEKAKIIQETYSDLYFLRGMPSKINLDSLTDLTWRNEKSWRGWLSNSGRKYGKIWTLNFASKYWAVKQLANAVTQRTPSLKDIHFLRDDYVMAHQTATEFGKAKLKRRMKHLDKILQIEFTDFLPEREEQE
tara:strand:- start:143 stop:547 length:405 start_codon:yes stop_codon:yes gene_type:complete